jgi:flagellar protein FliO/FliZ
MISNGAASFLWFLAIVALIPASLWFLKRTPLGGGGGNGVLKSIAAMPLSTSQRIVTIEVGTGTDRQWLILGVTPGSITTLHSMPAQDLGSGAAATLPPHPPFAQILSRFRRADPKDSHGR